MLDYGTRLSIRPGETARMELPFSEVNCHMGIAGQEVDVRLVAATVTGGRMQFAAQLVRNGHDWSFPITLGEVGIFQSGDPARPHFYYYPPMSAVLESQMAE